MSNEHTGMWLNRNKWQEEHPASLDTHPPIPLQSPKYPSYMLLSSLNPERVYLPSNELNPASNAIYLPPSAPSLDAIHSSPSTVYQPQSSNMGYTDFLPLDDIMPFQPRAVPSRPTPACPECRRLKIRCKKVGADLCARCKKKGFPKCPEQQDIDIDYVRRIESRIEKLEKIVNKLREMLKSLADV